MEQNEHKTLDSLCRYMTDANDKGETWRVVASDGCIEIVADFPPAADETDDDGKKITGYIVTVGITEDDIIRNLFNGRAGYGAGSYLDVPVLDGFTADSSVEELSLRLAAFGY